MHDDSQRKLWRSLWIAAVVAWFAVVPGALGLLAGLSVDSRMNTTPRFAIVLALIGLLLGVIAAGSILRQPRS